MTERGTGNANRGLAAARPSRSGNRGVCVRRCGAFTLIELLVTIAIIGILLSIVLPMLGSTIAASRGFKCQQALRSVAYDFQIFSDDNLHGYRGGDNSGQTIANNQFTLANFVESQYSIDEFWAWPGETRRELPDPSGNDPMRCPEVKGSIVLQRNVPCTGGGVSPFQSVSFGFNIRLHRQDRAGAPFLTLTRADIESAGPNVPLVWDVDGVVAASRNLNPLFSGPSLDSPVFTNERFWFPGLRHNRTGSFAFLDGHVASSTQPLVEETWDWGFAPRR